MESRLNYPRIAPEGFNAVLDLEKYVRASGLEENLLELIKVRASQINGCAFCIDMHTKDARENGETEQRLYGLDAWLEAPYYSDRERAALAWTEAVTNVGSTHVPDDVYQLARQQFNEKEIVDLTLAIAVINVWNRLAVSFRSVPGVYQPKARITRQAM